MRAVKKREGGDKPAGVTGSSRAFFLKKSAALFSCHLVPAPAPCKIAVPARIPSGRHTHAFSRGGGRMPAMRSFANFGSIQPAAEGGWIPPLCVSLRADARMSRVVRLVNLLCAMAADGSRPDTDYACFFSSTTRVAEP